MPGRKKESRKRQSPSSDAITILQTLNSESVELEGVKISKRDAHLTLLYMRSIKGEMSASVELQRIRERSGAHVPPKPVGYLVVPELMSDEDFEKLAFEQQAKFRERDYGKEDS